MSIGQEIREIRKRKGITLLDIEAKTGIGNGYLSRLERGQYSPSIDTVERICEAIGAELKIEEIGD